MIEFSCVLREEDSCIALICLTTVILSILHTKKHFNVKTYVFLLGCKYLYALSRRLDYSKHCPFWFPCLFKLLSTSCTLGELFLGDLSFELYMILHISSQ